MRWLRGRPLIYYTQIVSFTNFFSSLSSNNRSYIHHHRHFLSLLKNSSSSRPVALQVHSQLTTTGSLNQPLNTQIIFLFNTLLRHYALGEFPHQAFSLYKQAQHSTTLSVHFDSFTYSFLIKAFADLDYRFLGFQFHALVVKLGFGLGVYVQTALLNMYVDFVSMGEAQKVFDEMPERNLVTWNVMLTGLVKWGDLDAALSLFWEMPSRNIVSWTGIIDGCTQKKSYDRAYSLFRKMMMDEGIMPTEVTVLAIAPAIADLGDLKNCQSIHCHGSKSGLNSAIRVVNNLIDTYAKCGCVRSALQVFEEMHVIRRDLVSWTSVISGFAMHGMAKEAAETFNTMERLGFIPNRVTFLAILNAFSHSGLVEEGLQFFRRMAANCILEPDIKHYGCVIDMLGRAGKLKEAEEIAWETRNHIDSVVIWRTLLGACSVHGDTEMAERVTKKIQEMERGYGGDYILMSNILTGCGKFSDAKNVRTLMDERNVLKVAAHSMG